MDAKELDALMTKIAEGDNTSFGLLYNATIRGVFAFAYSYLGNREDAEDVAQNAYIAVKQKAYTYKKGTNARAWLFQIVKNLSLDELRRRKRRQSSDLDCAYVREESGSAVSFLLSVLDGEEKEIVVLHVFWGYKHREIAEILHMPLGTVTWKYNAAVKKLEKYKEEV